MRSRADFAEGRRLELTHGLGRARVVGLVETGRRWRPLAIALPGARSRDRSAGAAPVRKMSKTGRPGEGIGGGGGPTSPKLGQRDISIGSAQGAEFPGEGRAQRHRRGMVPASRENRLRISSRVARDMTDGRHRRGGARIGAMTDEPPLPREPGRAPRRIPAVWSSAGRSAAAARGRTAVHLELRLEAEPAVRGSAWMIANPIRRVKAMRPSILPGLLSASAAMPPGARKREAVRDRRATSPRGAGRARLLLAGSGAAHWRKARAGLRRL